MSELTADKTFYVRLDGDDTNNGLTSGNAFLTPQRAADETKKWRTGEFTITVDIGKGRFQVDESFDPGHLDGRNILWRGHVNGPDHTDDMAFGDLTYAPIPPDPAAPTYGTFSATIDDADELPALSTAAHALIRGASGDTNYHFLNGGHHIASWVEAEKTGILTWPYNSKTSPILGTDPMTVESLAITETEIRFHYTTGLRSSGGLHCGTWAYMSLRGSGYPDQPICWMSEQSKIVLGPRLVTVGNNALICQSNAVIIADGTFHYDAEFGPFALAETGGFISLRDAILNTSVAEAVIARDNGTIDLQGAELYCTGYPHSVVATRGGSINAADSTVLGCEPTGSVAFYMDTEGYIESNGAVSDAEKLRNPPYDPNENVLTANKAFYVRTDGSDNDDGLTPDTAFLTPGKASEMVKKYVLGLYNITVDVGEGTFNCAASLSPGSGEGANIVWGGVAAAHTSLTINNIDGSATALSAGLEYIDFDVNFAGGSGAAVGQFILVKTTSGGTNPNLVKGCHEIIAYSANVATVRCVRCAGVVKLPSGTITANTLTLVKTVFDFNSATDGIFEKEDKHCGTWNNMALKGDLAHSGVSMLRGASIVLGVNFGTSKWGTNLNCQASSSIHADYSVHSYGQNYLATADTDSFISLIFTTLSGCWATGVRAFDRGTINFYGGHLLCGGTYCPTKAMRSGYLNAILSNVEGVTPSALAAFYATSGGGIVATDSTDDAPTSYATEAAPGGNGAYVAY